MLVNLHINSHIEVDCAVWGCKVKKNKWQGMWRVMNILKGLKPGVKAWAGVLANRGCRVPQGWCQAHSIVYSCSACISNVHFLSPLAPARSPRAKQRNQGKGAVRLAMAWPRVFTKPAWGSKCLLKTKNIKKRKTKCMCNNHQLHSWWSGILHPWCWQLCLGVARLWPTITPSGPDQNWTERQTNTDGPTDPTGYKLEINSDTTTYQHTTSLLF